MSEVYNILFLCTGNSARSIMAEALLNAFGKGQFHAFSAGSHPMGSVHPLTMDLLKTMGYPSENLRSKSWKEFTEIGAPQMDFIITVCNDAAGETCPIWPGQPITAHWQFVDPARILGSEVEKRLAFKTVFKQIEKRINLLVNISIESLDYAEIQKKLREIGENQ